MGDRTRTQTSSCGEALAFGLVVAPLMVLSSLAVKQWGAIAFLLILAAMVAAVFGLVATGWVSRKGEGAWWLIVLMFAITTSEMVQALGMSLWGSWLLVIVIGLAGWLVGFRVLPWWQSRRGDSRQ